MRHLCEKCKSKQASGSTKGTFLQFSPSGTTLSMNYKALTLPPPPRLEVRLFTEFCLHGHAAQSRSQEEGGREGEVWLYFQSEMSALCKAVPLDQGICGHIL